MLNLKHLERTNERIQNKSQTLTPEVAAASPFMWPVLWSDKLLGFLQTAKESNLPTSHTKQLNNWFRSFASLAIGTVPKILLASSTPSSANALVFSWCDSSDVLKVLEGHDRYFGSLNQTSKMFETFYMIDGPLPEEQKKKLLEKGHHILWWERSPSKILLVVVLFLKTFIKNFRFSTIKHLATRNAMESLMIWDQLEKLIPKHFSHLKSVVFPYEAQPFQNYLCLKFSEVFGVKTIGYIHNSLSNYPSYMIYRHGSPQLLLVHGSAYRSLLATHCSWPEKNIVTIDSCRFQPKPASAFVGKVFLPYFFTDAEKIVETFTTLLHTQVIKTKLEIRVHPDKKLVEEHVKLLDALNATLESLPTKESERVTFFIGATTAMLEALEQGIECIQIVDDENLQAFSPDIWPALKIEKLAPKCFRYTLTEPGAFIRYSPNGTSLEAELKKIGIWS